MNIKELVQKYSLTRDDVWELKRGGRGIWILTHDACEKIAAIENIEIIDINIVSSEWNFCRLKMTIKKGDKKMISIGEALLTDGRFLEKKTKSGSLIPIGNCESQYLGCMAEKRSFDRCVLKLINAYECGVYSESESDDFKKGTNNGNN